MIKLNSIHLGEYEILVPILSNRVNPVRKPTSLYGAIIKMEPHGPKAVVPKKRPQGANIPYQRTNSSTGRTHGPLGSG
jgi:hypothetical protein